MATTSRSAGSRPSSNDAARTADGRGVCTFWLGKRHFGLDVSLVGEVVTIDTVTRVPMSPEPLRGLFNLRGAPVALLDLGPVLGLPDTHAAAVDTLSALVVRDDDLLVAFVIDRMEAVVPAGRGVMTDAAADDHPAVRGFLELPGVANAVTVLDPGALLERLEAVRFVKRDT